MISFLSIIAIGFFLGMRHATDPDHVIAVTTIVSRQNKEFFGVSGIRSRFLSWARPSSFSA
jgi:high-affinity nickel permease